VLASVFVSRGDSPPIPCGRRCPGTLDRAAGDSADEGARTDPRQAHRCAVPRATTRAPTTARHRVPFCHLFVSCASDRHPVGGAAGPRGRVARCSRGGTRQPTSWTATPTTSIIQLPLRRRAATRPLRHTAVPTTSAGSTARLLGVDAWHARPPPPSARRRRGQPAAPPPTGVVGGGAQQGCAAAPQWQRPGLPRCEGAGGGGACGGRRGAGATTPRTDSLLAHPRLPPASTVRGGQHPLV